jgi:3-oxoacyl-[acyl-carrier-protein] synthase III
MELEKLKDVYITAAGVYLPGEPVSNDEMESVLGLVDGKPSRYRGTVLRSNRIKSRYYAQDKDGNQTHLNEELAANAVHAALEDRGYGLDKVDMLATATTLPDTIMPGFGSMVHGRLGGRTMDVLSTSGICSASMTALKGAVNAIRVGEHSTAITVGSELVTPFMKGSRFSTESTLDESDNKADSYQFFNADFLRWMLSDGAGAVVLEDKPREDGVSLKIDWIDYRSYANDWPTCMYLGTSKTENLKVGDTYASYASMQDADAAGMFVIRQDTELLPKGLLASVITDARRLKEEGKIVESEIDHFLPHISSYFFYNQLKDEYKKVGINIPQEKWFTNLATKGNTGAASIYIMLEECLSNGHFKPGDRILCMVPESGRFSVSYAHFTCV